MDWKHCFIIGFVIIAFMTTPLLAETVADAEENGTVLTEEQGTIGDSFPEVNEESLSVEKKKDTENLIDLVDKAVAEEKGNDAEDMLDKKMTMFQLLLKGGIVGALIVLLSLIGLGLVIDYATTIRRSKLAPPDDIVIFKELCVANKLEELKDLAGKKPSFVSEVTIAGIKEINLGYQAMIKAMENTAEALSSRLARKIEHLNVIGNIAPMMGLLGTVIGMLRCFNEISRVTGAVDPKALASGIFEALITTCLGLIVAIPTLYFYAIFRNRVDELAGEATIAAEEIISTFKPESAKGEQ